VAAGTTNTLTDGTAYTEQSYQQKGTFFSEGQTYFSGSGTLNVTGNAVNAIACDDYIVVGGSVNVSASTATGHGIKVNDGFWMDGGTVTVNKSWACDNGYESADEADQAAHCVTVVGSPTTQTLAKKKVYVSYE